MDGVNLAERPAPGPARMLPNGYDLSGYRIGDGERLDMNSLQYKATSVDEDGKEVRVLVREYFPAGKSAREGVDQVSHAGPLSAEEFATGADRFKFLAKRRMDIQHVACAEVKQVLSANGTSYVILEDVEGETLSAMLDRCGKLPEDDVASIAVDLINLLEYLHERTHVHQRIEPHNIVVLPRSADESVPQNLRVKVIDMAPPKLKDSGVGSRHMLTGGKRKEPTAGELPDADQEAPDDAEEWEAPHTQYSAFEQYTPGGEVSARTDLYSLGGVLYHCICGRPPAGAMERILDDPMQTAVSAAPEGIQLNALRAIDAALSPIPRDRPSGISAFKEMFGWSWGIAPPENALSMDIRHGASRVGSRGSLIAARRSGDVTKKASGPSGFMPTWATTVMGLGGLILVMTWVDVGVLREVADASPMPPENRTMPKSSPMSQVPYTPSAAAMESLQLERDQGDAKFIDNGIAVQDGPVLVDSTPTGAQVEWRGQVLGNTPLRWDVAPAAGAILLLRKNGYMDTEMQVAPVVNELVRYSVDMELSDWGTLTLATLPAGATIVLPGLDDPYTAGMRMPRGPVQVVVVAEGYEDWTGFVEVFGDSAHDVVLTRRPADEWPEDSVEGLDGAEGPDGDLGA